MQENNTNTLTFQKSSLETPVATQRTIAQFRKRMAEPTPIEAGSELYQIFHLFSQEALRITSLINGTYHTPDQLRQLFADLWAIEVPVSFGCFPPFYTDCGKNTHIGERVFINAGCKFQDQGGIYIADDALIGHNATLCTLNHLQDPNKRASMVAKSIHIGKKVWIGANVTILQGVTVGDNAIVAAGAVVTKAVAPNTIVGGVPARFIKNIEI